MANYYFPEIETLVGRPYGKSTRYILIGLLVLLLVIGIVYFLIISGYINTVSPSNVYNPKNIQNGSPQSGSPINTNNVQTNTTSGSGSINSNNPNPNGTTISGNGQNLNGNGNIIY
jgi:hypothetical protein